MARTLLLHLRLHWPDEFHPNLWPFALDYAVYIYNHMPTKGKAGMPSPQEVFCGTKIGRRPLRRLKVFGCPTYVLDPRLQDGKKIPKWEPRSRKGQFLGFSKLHASTVSLIRNIRTGYISPQFHVVFDEQFTTVVSEAEIDLSESWTDLFLNSREHYLEGHDVSADGPIPQLDPDFASADELPLEQPPSTSQGESVVSQGESVTSQGEAAQQNIPPTSPEETAHNQVPPVQQQPTQPSTDQQSASRGVGWHDVEEAPPRQSQHEQAASQPEPQLEPQPPQSPLLRRSQRTRASRDEWKEPPLTYSKRGGSATLLKRVASRLFTYTVLSSCPNVIAAATVDWHKVSSDPEYHYFDSLF